MHAESRAVAPPLRGLRQVSNIRALWRRGRFRQRVTAYWLKLREVEGREVLIEDIFGGPVSGPDVDRGRWRLSYGMIRKL